MRKRKKLTLSRETLATLEAGQAERVKGRIMVKPASQFACPDVSEVVSADGIFCWPSAINTVCLTHCPCFTCGRC